MGESIGTHRPLYRFPASYYKHEIMKAVFVFFFLCMTLQVTWAQADLHTALGNGDVPGISIHFGDKVELAIGDKEETLAKADVETRLREFYATHVPKGFSPKHNGTSKSNESTYTIGELSTDKGDFRVYIYFTQQGEKRSVAELRIEE